MQKKLLFIFPKRKQRTINSRTPIIPTEIPKNVETMKSTFISSYLEKDVIDTSIPVQDMDMTTLIIVPTVVIFFLIIVSQKK